MIQYNTPLRGAEFSTHMIIIAPFNALAHNVASLYSDKQKKVTTKGGDLHAEKIFHIT